jgi:outer membrane protein assembly factor BamB
MPARTRTGIVCHAMLATSLLGWVALASGSDWPQWGGHDDRNMVASAAHLPACFVPGKKRPDGSGVDPKTTDHVRWVARLGSQVYASPSIAGGRVFVSTNDGSLRDPRYEETGGGVLMCLDEATGKPLWQLAVRGMERTAKTRKYHNHLQVGICSPPTVEGDRVYVVTNRAEVLCLDVNGMANGNDGPFTDECHYTRGEDQPPAAIGPNDADIIWRFDMLRELPIFPHDANCSAVLIHGDVLYVGTANGVDDHCTPCPLAPSLIALDKHTGRLVGYDDAKIGTRVFHGQWSSPSLGRVGNRDLVFFGGGDGICYAFEALESAPDKAAPLKCVWSCDCNPPEYRFRDGKPIDYWDGAIGYSDSNHDDGSYVGPSEIIATPVFYKNRVYVAIGQDPTHGRGRGMLTCIDATKTGDISKTGKVWTFDLLDRSLSTVSIADGLLYIADLPGNLYCLDAETGKCYWVYDTKQQVWGSTLVADGKIYLGTRKALWVFAAGKEKHLLDEIRLGSPIWATPVAADGALYVASQRYLWATEPSKPHNSSGLAKTPAPPRTLDASRASVPGRQSLPGKRQT